MRVRLECAIAGTVFLEVHGAPSASSQARVIRRRWLFSFDHQGLSIILRILLPGLTIFFLTLEEAHPLISAAMGYCQEPRNTLHAVVFVLKRGFTEEGAPTSEWGEAIRGRHDDEALSQIMASARELSKEEMLWAELIKKKIKTWPELIDSLSIPFRQSLFQTRFQFCSEIWEARMPLPLPTRRFALI